jgi:LPXTG-site transpeptidase (sortase) family protein
VNSTGVITFTPLPSFTGTATPVAYSVTDSLGQKVSTTYTPTVGLPFLPTASPNTSIDAHDVNQVFNPISNDTAGASSFPLDPTTVKLCAVGTNANCALTSLTVTGVGVYTVNPTTGAVTFNPESTFDGTAPAVTYAVEDSLARVAYSTITPTVVPLPVALNDTPSAVPYATSQTITPLDNDSAATGYILVASTLKFCGVNPAQVPNGCTLTTGTITTVDGTYTINGTSIVFTPAVNFTGTVTQPIRYQVADSLGQISTAVITPSVLPPTPATVTPNSSSNNWDVNQPILPLNNDTPTQNASWTISTLKLCSSAQASPNCTQTSVTIANQGTYTIDPATGVVTFDPLPTFVGTATPVSYQITDSYGATLSSTITPTVVAAAPVATSQTVTVLPTQNATFSTITGATGLTSQGSAPINAVCLITPGSNPATCDADGIVTVANQGTYTLNPATGVVTFVPVAGLLGGTALTPITYKVTDQAGLTATATLTVITPPPPLANPNVSFGAYETPQTISPLGNDVPGSASAPLVASTVKLCATGQTGLACNASSVTTAEGTYTVSTNGIVTFIPVAGYSGPEANGSIQAVAHPVTYVVQDSLGQLATSTITPTVYPQPATAAIPDSGSAAWTPNVTVTINPLTNDSKGTPPPAFVTVGTLALDPATVHFCAPIESAPNCTLNSLTTADGTYTINNTTGVVTFDPVISFTGTVTVVPIYQICNSVSGTWTITGNTSATPNSTCATSTITPTITPPPSPVATPNTTTGLLGATQISNLLTNDFLNGVPVDSVHLCAVGQVVPNCTATTLTLANVGTYSVNTTSGVITFTPLPTYVGTPAPVKYVVKDILGAVADSTYTPTVTPLIGPTATPETRTTTVATPVSFSNITGIAGLATQGSGAITTPRTCLVDPTNASICSSSVITADGIWSLDSSTGIATYTPNADTPVGTKIAITYKVTDVNGMIATSTLTPIIAEAITIQSPPVSSGGSAPVTPERPTPPPTKPVTPKPMPKALPDVKSGKLNQVINITPVLNDVQAVAPLVPTTIVLCTVNCKTIAEAPTIPAPPENPTEPAQPASPQPIVTAQGTWTVNADSGRVQFTPVKNWFGVASVNYVMFDADGNPVVSKITVVIPKPVLPKKLSYTGDAKTLVPKKQTAGLQSGSYVATMVAPRLGAKWIKKVYEGTSLSKVLTPLGLGHYSETQMPGQVGNFAVAAHRFGSGGPFLNIDKFRAGDLVYVSTGTAKYTYRYLQTKVVKPSAIEVLLPLPGGMTADTDAKSFMTLQTCTPVHINTYRLIVWFELINSEIN